MAPFDFAKRNGAQTLLFSQPHIFRKKSFQPNENSRLRSDRIRRFKILLWQIKAPTMLHKQSLDV